MQVSVIIPVYNAAPFLDKCLQSAFDQPQTGEVILIDDRSTDGSWEKCEAWVKKDKRVRLFRNEGIKGAGAARNVGLRNATCEYIAFLDADDYYLDGRFDEDDKIFRSYIHIDAIASTTIISNNKGKNPVNYNLFNKSLIGPKKKFDKISILTFNTIQNFHFIALTVKKNALKINFEFDESLKQGEDLDFIYRLLHYTNTVSSNNLDPKVVYRIHDKNTTLQKTETIFYRRQLYLKLFKFTIQHKINLAVIWHNFKTYIEYDFLWFTGGKIKPKKLFKILLLPVFVYRLMFKTDISYDKDRTIHLS
ncbi:MAG: glycosyltransferase family 2 protein [Saprospiraceae bacterium]|nr:glycosyltransferase family 2 protein [Saprospiraceae bacterium]